MIERILPPPVAVAEAFGDDPFAVLFPEERAVIARAAESRRREFATGRTCARRALIRLGLPSAPVLPEPGGMPKWPEGVVGSITHCTGYRAAALARTSDVISLGVDAEPNESLSSEAMLNMIALGEERSRLADLATRMPDVSWDRLLFSAKEAVYKTWFPLARRWLDFRSVDIVIDADAGAFTAHLLVPAPPAGGSPLTMLHGRWLADRGLLVTAVVVPSGRGVTARRAGAE
jgi:4'-phosphopantetheinyl transferase EntD